MLRMLVIFVVVSVIVAECAVAYLCLPSGGDATATAATMAAKPAAKPAESQARSESHDAKADEGETSGMVEEDMGEFSVTSFQPASNSTLRIDFHLYGSVAAENQKELHRLIEENKHRFREQVVMTVRSAEMSDLTEASLGLLKRTIFDKAKRTLGKPLLREIIISDYSFIEQ